MNGCFKMSNMLHFLCFSEKMFIATRVFIVLNASVAHLPFECSLVLSAVSLLPRTAACSTGVCFNTELIVGWTVV